VDLTHYIQKIDGAGGGRENVALRERRLLGANFSPYQMGQCMGHVKERIMVNPRNLGVGGKHTDGWKSGRGPVHLH
jgi:hypothetical protein